MRQAKKNKKLDDLLGENFSAQERQEIERRALAMLFEVRLAELRRSQSMTQEEVAENLERNQSAIAALEKRDDMLLSTLRRYVRAMGGDIEVIARIPGKPPVRIALGA